MFVKKHDIVEILDGTDFQENNLKGRRALVINSLGPDYGSAHIRIEGLKYDMFYPKELLKVVERK